MISTSIAVDQTDMRRIQGLIQRVEKELGKSQKDAVRMAGYYIADSLGASTRVAPKKRKVHKTTARNLGMSGRLKKIQRASVKAIQATSPFGVFRWNKNGEKIFVPIKSTDFRTKEIKAKNGTTLIKNLDSGTIVHHSKAAIAFSSATKKGSKESALTIVKRSGLAKKAWKWIQKTRTGNAKILGVDGVAQYTFRSDKYGTFLRMVNALRYATSAFKTFGNQAVESAMTRAFNRMSDQVNKKIAKALASK